MQLAANKDQLRTISVQLDSRDSTIAALKQKVALLEKQLAGSLKELLLQAQEDSPKTSTPKVIYYTKPY